MIGANGSKTHLVTFSLTLLGMHVKLMLYGVDATEQ